MLQTIRAEKEDERKRCHLSSFPVSFLSYGLQFQKISFSTKTLLVLLMSALKKNQRFLAKIVPLLKAIL